MMTAGEATTRNLLQEGCFLASFSTLFTVFFLPFFSVFPLLEVAPQILLRDLGSAVGGERCLQLPTLLVHLEPRERVWWLQMFSVKQLLKTEAYVDVVNVLPVYVTV